jgi:diguanylate cyclase (GGDEF)-like protein
MVIQKILQQVLILTIAINIASAKNTDITLQLSWFDQFQFAGYYIAKEKGFYEEEDLHVDIKPFEFDLDIPSGVSEGVYDFAIGRETLILEKANNIKIVSLYALFQASPLILIATKESGIDTIAHFADKKIMTTIDDTGEVSIKAMLVSQDVDVKNLNFIDHTHNINDLIDKKTDIMSAYISKAPYFLQKNKIAYNVFAPKEHGFDMYSDLLYTSEFKIKNDLETVLKFKKASLKGWEYAYTHIEEAVDLILQKYNTQKLSKEELLFEANELKKLSYYQTDILGDIKIDKLQRIYDLYNIMGLVKKPINIKEFVFVDDSFATLIEREVKKLSQYIHLPYIYFFIGLFLFLIFFAIYKQIALHKTTQKLKVMNEELKLLSERDHLTKLYNRRYFESIVKEYLHLLKRNNINASILLIDIDDFKHINDSYGHQIGDKILCLLANLMQKYKRESDVISRYGGEEFVALLPNTSLEGAKTYAENLRKEVENQSIKINGIKIKLTISIGLTTFKADDNIYKAISRADTGLYNAKRSGKNQIDAQ